MIGTCSETIIEAQNPRIFLNHSYRFEIKIFEPELEGFLFCLSPNPLSLLGSDYQTVEDLHELENREYVEPIAKWFQEVISIPYSLII